MAITKPREKFDPQRAFVVGRRSIRFRGQMLASGEPFDKTQVSVRRLRQLYDTLYLNMAAPDYSVPPSGDRVDEHRPVADRPLSLMEDGELRVWLGKRGVIPRRTADRAALLERAERVLVEGA